MNLKKLFDRFTRVIWIQVIVLVAALWGVASLVGASFENVENSSKIRVSTAEESGMESSAPEESEDPLDDLFTDGSGAFGDWDEFSELPKTSQITTPSKPASSSESSVPESETPSSEPETEDSSVPEEPEESTEPGGSSPGDAIVIDPDADHGQGPGDVSSEPSSIPSLPAESSQPELPASSEETEPAAGGESPLDAPSESTQG